MAVELSFRIFGRNDWMSYAGSEGVALIANADLPCGNAVDVIRDDQGFSVLLFEEASCEAVEMRLQTSREGIGVSLAEDLSDALSHPDLEGVVRALERLGFETIG